jgi:TonB family protein
MRTIFWLIVAAGTASAALAQNPPPPPVFAPHAAPSERAMLAWMPGEVRCGGEAISATMMRRPLVTLAWPYQNQPASVGYRFRIDETGRPLSIKRSDSVHIPQTDDIAPSLAAARFDRGAARADCEITYAQRRTSLETAPIEDLISYSLNPIAGDLPKAGWDRIKPVGTTCLDAPRPQPLTQVFPDFNKVASTPGVRDWSMVAYDQDTDGKPTNVRIDHGTRNAALNTASVEAIKDSTYSGGARIGCRYPYWRAPGRMAAPPTPDPETLRPAGSTCPTNGDWATRPALVYPEAYRRRSIEGVAIIAFDVASWGETGNFRVLASEPSEAFGQQAISMIRAAKKAPSQMGQVGCIERLRFVMAQADTEVPNGPPPVLTVP